MDQPPVAEKGGYAFRRPRHTLRGRQDRQAIAQSAEHLSALKRQAEAGAIELLFADEAEASTHPYLARLWARRGADLRVEAPGKAHKRALFGARRHASGELIVQTASSKDSERFCNFLEHLKPLGKDRRVHLVLDNGSIHTSRKTQAALARAQHWLTVEWLPSYAPELNDIERDWRHLKCHYLAHQTFINIDILERTLHRSIKDINHDRLQYG